MSERRLQAFHLPLERRPGFLGLCHVTLTAHDLQFQGGLESSLRTEVANRTPQRVGGAL